MFPKLTVGPRYVSECGKKTGNYWSIVDRLVDGFGLFWFNLLFWSKHLSLNVLLTEPPILRAVVIVDTLLNRLYGVRQRDCLSDTFVFKTREKEPNL